MTDVTVVAALLGRHAVAVLLVVVALLLAATGAFWWLVERNSNRLWKLWLRARTAFASTALVRRLRHSSTLAPAIDGTLTVTRFLSIYALAAFAVAAAALWTFFEFVDEVGEHEWLTQFDESLSAALREHLSTGTLQAFAMITKLGDPEFLIPFGTFVTVALCAVRLWLHAGVWVVVTSGGALLNQFLKSVFERSRPLHDHGLVSETSWSFPSGHASGSMVVYGLLAYLLVRHTPRAWHLPVTLVAIVLIVFVGSSRVLLQVHYLSDVLAGFASGATWVGLSIAGLEAARGHESKRGL